MNDLLLISSISLPELDQRISLPCLLGHRLTMHFPIDAVAAAGKDAIVVRRARSAKARTVSNHRTHMTQK